MQEIVPKLYQLRVPTPYNSRFTNVYALARKDGLTLVDAGANAEESLSGLRDELLAAGYQISDIRTILMTHYHQDHSGLVPRLQEETCAEVLIHSLDAQMAWRSLESVSADQNGLGNFLKSHGAPDEVIAASYQDPNRAFLRPEHIHRFLEDGESLQLSGFFCQVIWTPGHSPGHICLYLPNQRLLLTGDHVLRRITPHIGLGWDQRLNPLGDYLASLRKLASLEVDLVLPAHGPILRDAPRRIEQILRHHDHRMLLCLDALASEPQTGYQVSLVVFGEHLPPHHRRLALTETLAHLELLVAKGTVERISQNGRYLYRTTNNHSHQGEAQ
ncbi:MAG: MBL fold metallo-hydrolase [Chloroflexi bacterium]|nr:MBL fold metallo-hydrolase [Chloroflexota bacterium]